MHELAIVGALVERLLAALPDDAARIDAVRVRRGSAFSEDALRQGFELLARGTPLESARLEIETADLTVDCPCGRSRPITPDELVGHIYVCPDCGHVRDAPGADDLTLLGVSYTPAR